MSDLIERQAAIDAVGNMLRRKFGIGGDLAEITLAGLPSAQPEPPKTDKAAERLNDLIFDINPAEICSQIESDNLKNWCIIIQTEMKMAMVQLPCWAERREE